MISRYTKIAGACMLIAVVGWGWYEAARDTYDETRPVNPLSAVQVSNVDLEGASPCTRAAIESAMHNGLKPSRSELFYTRWKCDIAERDLNNQERMPKEVGGPSEVRAGGSL